MAVAAALLLWLSTHALSRLLPALVPRGRSLSILVAFIFTAVASAYTGLETRSMFGATDSTRRLVWGAFVVALLACSGLDRKMRGQDSFSQAAPLVAATGATVLVLFRSSALGLVLGGFSLLLYARGYRENRVWGATWAACALLIVGGVGIVASFAGGGGVGEWLLCITVLIANVRTALAIIFQNEDRSWKSDNPHPPDPPSAPAPPQPKEPKGPSSRSGPPSLRRKGSSQRTRPSGLRKPPTNKPRSRIHFPTRRTTTLHHATARVGADTPLVHQ